MLCRQIFRKDNHNCHSSGSYFDNIELLMTYYPSYKVGVIFIFIIKKFFVIKLIPITNHLKKSVRSGLLV